MQLELQQLLQSWNFSKKLNTLPALFFYGIDSPILYNVGLFIIISPVCLLNKVLRGSIVMSNEYDGVEILEYAQELRILNYCAFLLLFL